MASSSEFPCAKVMAAVLLLMVCFAGGVESRPVGIQLRKLMKLVESPPLILTYHNGPLLTGPQSLPVYIIWYGNFGDSQRSIVRDFLSSFQSADLPSPSVSSWWKPTQGYRDGHAATVPAQVHLEAEIVDGDYSKGKSLKHADIEEVVLASLRSLPVNSKAFYLVLTAEDVEVQGFCMNSCASHSSTAPTGASNGQQLPFAWVGNASQRCPGKCAWPFAQAEYGPQTAPLLAPNGDVGMDGMVLNIAAMLAGAATNPFNSGFYQGDGAAPLEAATACAGTYGEGAYPGYTGQLSVDPITGVSFNVYGSNDRRFLLPSLWDPASLKCTISS